MSPKNLLTTRTRKSGQTLVIALIILGILLILGFLFVGFISRNIANTGRSQQRTVANDLAEAGIRFVHSQLLNSELGADWRLNPTPPASPRDPDYQYLQVGGPDGLGSYTRINFDAGRAIVRLRYAPSDANIFNVSSQGALKQAGLAKNYLIIESVGKAGRFDANDPTTASTAVGQERERRESRKLIAFASIGLIEQAMFITNKFNVSSAAELGVPDNLGARYSDTGAPVPIAPALQLGTAGQLYTFATSSTGSVPTGTALPHGGGIRVNGSLVLHGNTIFNINRAFGDGILVTETLLGAQNTSQLQLNLADVNRTTGFWNPVATVVMTNITNPSMDSRSNNFGTQGGVIKDGVVGLDSTGFPRGVRRIEGPSILRVDPESGQTRYRRITSESGALGPAGNTGRFGYGRNIYISNNADRQIAVDETGREIRGAQESLQYDWLNPNNGQPNSGWQGAFYVPKAAYLQLLPDGFTIVRDDRTWRRPDGSDSGSSVLRYRLKRVGNQIYVINNLTPGVADINANTIADNVFTNNGYPFGGVLYFEGNVRVRGVIPTDVQLSVVSNATIYIEGSITKGVVDNQVRTPSLTTPTGSLINSPSRSMIMLMAKDYVALNTTQFFGTGPSQTLEEVAEIPSATKYNPIRMRVDPPGTLTFRAEMLLDPETGTPGNPSTWTPFASNYVKANADGTPSTDDMDQSLVMTHAMDDGPAPTTFISMDINPGVGQSAYLFDLRSSTVAYPAGEKNEFDPDQRNTASQFAPYSTSPYTEPGYGAGTADRGLLYGLGGEPWQRYSRFETTAFPIADAGSTVAYPLIASTTWHGNYNLLAQETNEFVIRHNNVGGSATNDYLVARAALIPNDIRIEASIYAEEGSFFVIPGPWFNPEPNDTRANYIARVAAVGQIQADIERRDNFGASPITPFYGEPIDVRVMIVGSVSQNMPPPISQQAEWLRKWGWIPRTSGSAGRMAANHVPANYTTSDALPYVPNLIITYDPALGTGRANGYDQSLANPVVRVDENGNMLPPMPRLPVSPTLAYFGEVNQ